MPMVVNYWKKQKKLTNKAKKHNYKKLMKNKDLLKQLQEVLQTVKDS